MKEFGAFDNRRHPTPEGADDDKSWEEQNDGVRGDDERQVWAIRLALSDTDTRGFSDSEELGASDSKGTPESTDDDRLRSTDGTVVC